MAWGNICHDYQQVSDSQDLADDEKLEKRKTCGSLRPYVLVTVLNVLFFVLAFWSLLISIGFWRLGKLAACEKSPDIIYCKPLSSFSSGLYD